MTEKKLQQAKALEKHITELEGCINNPEDVINLEEYLTKEEIIEILKQKLQKAKLDFEAL